MENNINPFNITKAVDLTDNEIQEFWVDIANENGVLNIVKPTSPMPMIILGGKGSGKTHIMRYFSYPLQRLRGESHFVTLQEEGFLGIYFRCGGLNSKKFEGNNQTDEKWQKVYIYFMELWLSELLIETIIKFFKENPNLLENEKKVSKLILSLFDIEIKLRKFNFENILKLIITNRKKIDYSVNNLGLGISLKGIKIKASPGKLIFGIPKILSEQISCFKSIKFLYLIDEFENLTEQQQQYIQTLLREKELPTTFKLGARLYGLKTKFTFSASEENKEGSEFEKFCIDDYFRDYNKYEDFIRNLCIKRLIKYGYNGIEKSISDFDNNFEAINKENYIKLLIEKNGKKYFEKLKSKLLKFNYKRADEILSLLGNENSPILERTNVLLFFRDCKNGKKKDFLNIAKEISNQMKLFDSKGKTRQNIVLEKFKKDIEDQIILECGGKLFYTGLKSFVRMSAGIPRNLLTILKHIYTEAYFNGENPFRGNQISCESQRIGVKRAAEWFFDDAKIKGTYGKKVKDSISRLALFLREIRFSDLPPECSLSAFTYNVSEISEETNSIIESAEQSSYVIKIGERRGKNTKSLDPIYQINGLLCPLWDLPIIKRGEVKLTKFEINGIFNPNSDEEFKNILKNKLSDLNFLSSKNSVFLEENVSNYSFNLFKNV